MVVCLPDLDEMGNCYREPHMLENLGTCHWFFLTYRVLYKWWTETFMNLIIAMGELYPKQRHVTKFTCYIQPIVAILFLKALWFYCCQNFKSFVYPIFRYWAYPMKVIPENASCALSLISTSCFSRFWVFWQFPPQIKLTVTKLLDVVH